MSNLNQHVKSDKVKWIVTGAVIAVILLVWIISKIIGVFSGGKKNDY